MPDVSQNGTHTAIPEAECRALLAAGTVGRLAFTDGALPAVVPTPYVLHDGQVVVATRRGSAMASAVRKSVVAFEVDSFGDGAPGGWAVTVVGPSRLVTRPSEVAELDRLHGGSHLPMAGRCYVAVRTDLVSGWRTTSSGASVPRAWEV